MISDRDRHGAWALQRRIAALAASAKCDLARERYQSWLREMDAHLAATGGGDADMAMEPKLSQAVKGTFARH
jgi:hypothetical protein